MNKKLLTLTTAWTILFFANKWYWNEIASTFIEHRPVHKTEVIKKEIKNVLNDGMDYKTYESKKNN